MPDRVLNHLVCYDIRDPRRLRRVHRMMRTWGLPLQYSVFHCRLRAAERARLAEALRRRIDERVDDVRIYAIHGGGAIYYRGRPPAPTGLMVEGLVLRPLPLAAPGVE